MYSESGLETAVFQGRSSSHEHESIIIFYGLNDTLGKGREGKGREGKGREGKWSEDCTSSPFSLYAGLSPALPSILLFPLTLLSLPLLPRSSPFLSSPSSLPPSPTLFVWQCYNKIDQISIEEVDRLARQPNSVVVRSADEIEHY